MSDKTRWEPGQKDGNVVGGIELKAILQRCELLADNDELDSTDDACVWYLTALRDARIEGAAELLVALKEHVTIRIYTED